MRLRVLETQKRFSLESQYFPLLSSQTLSREAFTGMNGPKENEMTASFLGKLPGNSRADLPGKFQDAVSMLLLFPNSYGLPGPLCKHREKGQFTTGQSFTVCSQLRNRK